jgi:hypothetical protein
MIESMLGKNKTTQTPPIEAVAVFTLGFCAICIVGWILWWVRYGIDFADEGFYLVWLSNPSKYSVSLSQFGYIYHPLYKLVNGNIAALRQANVLITFSLAWILCLVYLTEVFASTAISILKKCVIAAALATASLCFFTLWLPTPSYNALAFQALMISMIGLLIAKKHFSGTSILGWLLIGVGGWLAFMAKPTSAVALGLFAFLYLAGSRKLSVTGLSSSILSATLFTVFFAMLVDGSVFGFRDRLLEGMRLARLVSPDYDAMKMVRVGDIRFSKSEVNYLVFGIIGIVAAVHFSRFRNTSHTILWAASFALAASTALWVVFIADHTLLKSTLWVHLIILSVPIALLLIGVFNGKFRGMSAEQASRQWPLFLVLMAFPYAFAFGTGGNYWTYAGFASLFWILAGLSFIEPANSDGRIFPLISIAVCVELFTGLILLVPMEEPYYQPHPLRNSSFKIDIGRSGSTLIIPATYGKYISRVVDQAKHGGFKPGMPVIDLTGHSPGVLYALQASSVGSAWFYGNFGNTRKTAEIAAIEVLKNVNCEEISKSWLLLEPEGPVRISSEILMRFGIDVASDYLRVGDFSTETSLGGFAEVQRQELLKPIRSITTAIAACELAKMQRLK